MTRGEWLKAVNAKLDAATIALADARVMLASIPDVVIVTPPPPPPPPPPDPNLTEINEKFTWPILLGRETTATYIDSGGKIDIADENWGRINCG